MTAALEVDRELGLERDEVQLLEPLALGLRPRLVRDVGERLTPPEGEGVGEEDAGVVEPAELPGLDRGGDVALEPGGIDLLGRDVEDVAGRAGDEDGRRRAGGAVRLEDPAQVRDVGLQRRGGRGRRLAVPELVDEPVDGDDPPRLEQEQREQGPVFGRAELDRAALGDHRERAEQRELQTFRRQGAHSRVASSGASSSSSPSESQGRVRTVAVMPDSELPGDVRATIGRRVELLADDTRRMLAAASVLGRRFDVATLAATTRIDPDVVTAALAEAVAAEVVVDEGDGHYVFAHALVEDTLYDRLTRRAGRDSIGPRPRRSSDSRRRSPARRRSRTTTAVRFPPATAPGPSSTRAAPGADAAERGASEQAVQHFERAREAPGSEPSTRRARVAVRPGRRVRHDRPARAGTGHLRGRDRARRALRRHGRPRAAPRSA